MRNENVLIKVAAGSMFICEHPSKKFSDDERSQIPSFVWEDYWCRKPANWELPDKELQASERNLEDCIRLGRAYGFACEDHKNDLLYENESDLSSNDTFVPEIGMVFLFKQSNVRGTVVKVQGNGIILKMLGRESNMITVEELLKEATQI